MKKLITIMILGSIILTSCSDDQINNPDEETAANSVYVTQHINGQASLEIATIEDNAKGPVVPYGVNSLHAHGQFHGYGPGGQISFNGTQNFGGAHGGGKLSVTFGPFGTAVVELQTVSLINAGDDEVIFGGVVTEVFENTVSFPPPPPGGPPPPPCDPYDLGTYVYFRVKDNGQGNNAPADQYHTLLTNSCSENPSKGANLPWFFGNLVDVAHPSDKIKVNN